MKLLECLQIGKRVGLKNVGMSIYNVMLNSAQCLSGDRTEEILEIQCDLLNYKETCNINGETDISAAIEAINKFEKKKKTRGKAK